MRWYYSDLLFILLNGSIVICAALSHSCSSQACGREGNSPSLSTHTESCCDEQLPCTNSAHCMPQSAGKERCLNGIPLSYGKCLCHFGYTGGSCETLTEEGGTPTFHKVQDDLYGLGVCVTDDCEEYLKAQDMDPNLNNLQWTVVPQKHHRKPLNSCVEREYIFEDTFVAISTGLQGSMAELHVAPDTESLSRRGMLYRFSYFHVTTGSKSRLEISTCFTTVDEVFAKYNMIPEEIEHLMKTSCGVVHVPSGQVHTYTYEIRIPRSDHDAGGQCIITQWHGSPDPTIIRDDFGCVAQIPVSDLHKICASGKCKQGRILDSYGQLTGLRYNQGGYPPLTMMFKDGYILVTARSDERSFIPKKGCKAPGYGPTKCDCHPRQQHDVIWSIPAEQFPYDTWVKFRWQIKWSTYCPSSSEDRNPGSLVSDAVIRVWMNDEKIVDWTGPCGRNDHSRAPYFKAGIYNPSGSAAHIRLFLRRFQHYYGAENTDDLGSGERWEIHGSKSGGINQNVLKSLEPFQFLEMPSESTSKCVLRPNLRSM